MRCPVCQEAMARGSYEDLPVFRCSTCHGYLVDSGKARTIRNRAGQETDALMAEVSAEQQPDTARPLKCPRCLRTMKKQRVRMSGEFHLDVCDECRFLWFDGGELALWQLMHENTEQGQEAAEMQRRHREMTAEERAELQERIDELPDEPSLLQTLFEAATDGMYARRWRRWRRG